MRFLQFLWVFALTSIIQANQDDTLVGNWTGTSICQAKNTACKDENVVFHILKGNTADLFRVDADKIVDGKAIDMGELDFTLNKATHTLTCVYPGGTWVLVAKGTHIDGTLTMRDNVLFKKLSLTRAR